MMRLTDVMHLPGLHTLDMEQVALYQMALQWFLRCLK